MFNPFSTQTKTLVNDDSIAVAGVLVGCAGWGPRHPSPVGLGKAMRGILRAVFRLRRCGLYLYTPKSELQEALRWHHNHNRMLDRINRELMRDAAVKNYWLARGRQMGVIK